MKKVIAIGDLGHITKFLSNNFTPLNIGFIGAYIDKKFPAKTAIYFFIDSEKLLTFVEEKKPDFFIVWG